LQFTIQLTFFCGAFNVSFSAESAKVSLPTISTLDIDNNVTSAVLSKPIILTAGVLIPLIKQTVDHSEKFDKFAASQLSIA